MMNFPEKYRKYRLKLDNVDPKVLAYSQQIFKNSLLESRILNDLAKCVPKHVGIEEEPTMPSAKMKKMTMMSARADLQKDDGIVYSKSLTSGSQAERLIYETYDLIRAGESQTVFNPNYKDVTLVVGNSGTGKSTLVQFIAGDISQLKAVKKGSGFVIEDAAGRISKKDDNSVSKTLFPELIINETGKLAYYDCPGFKDNRGTAFAMAASHFTKLVFDKAEKIKIHICVDNAVANGAERGQAFIEAIKHVGEFMKQAEKFKISFSMTATKVPYSFDFDEETGAPVIKTDDAEIQGIGDTIKSDSIPLIKSQLVKETDEKARQILENALTVFEALSTMENGKYTRIGLFRTPQVAGLLSKSTIMIKSKETIISAIEAKTEFVVVSKGDFNYTIDATTKVQMLTVGRDINMNMKQAMEEIGNEIKKDCTDRMLGSNNWKKTEAFLVNVKPTLDEYSKKLKTMKTLEKSFISGLDEYLRAADVTISKDKMRHLERQLGCLAFLENMFDEISTIIPVAALDDANKLVAQAVVWYKTLYAVYETLSSDFYQEKRDNYNVANLDDWGTSTNNKGLRLSAEMAPRFFKLLKVDIDALGDFPLTEVRMNELNSVVHLTLVEKMEIKVTSAGVLLATGPFILLSRVLDEYRKEEGQVKSVNIFASCVFYVDTDFTAPSRHMIIASPKWKVKKNVRISLDGKSGEDKSGSAADGRGVNAGEDGIPGESGKVAGHFIGIADSIDNADFLTITANGGRGGRGQDGGKGGPAAIGIDARMPTDSSWTGYTPPGENGVSYRFISGWHNEKDETIFQTWYKNTIYYRILGKRAKNGERGGHGGVGGFGGSKGELVMTIFSPTPSKFPKVQHNDGHEGENGSGGVGGDGGKNGNDLKARFWRKEVVGVRNSEWEQDEVYDMGYSQTGPRGQSGGNRAGRPKKEEQAPVTIMALSLNIFKGEAIRFASNSPLRRAELKMMLARIDETETFNALYTIPGYLNEMITLESLYYSIFKSIDTTPFYSSLLERIKAYADAHKSNADKIKRLAMSTIYASCLSKLCSLKLGNRSQEVIVDLDTYMGLTLKKIDGLATIDKRLAIKQFQDSYHESFALKVNEANQLMKSKVNPAIEKILRSMDDKLDKLVIEVLEKQEAAEDKKAELIEQKKQMEKALIIKSCLNVLKMGAMLASFAGPIGAAVGGVVTAGATIGESFVVEPDVKKGDAILVPPGVSDALKSLGNFVVETRAKNMEKFETQLKSIQDELKDPPVDLQEVNKKVTSIRERLDQEKAKKVPDGDEDAAKARDETVDKLQKELNGVIKEKKTGLEEQIAKGDKAKKNILDKVDKLQKGLKVIEAGLDVYNKYKGDKKKLDTITDSIAAADKTIGDLQQYESNIQSSMFPMVRKMRDDVNKVTASLSTKSQVALDVTQWEVQGTLRVIRNTLEKVMQGFAAQTEVSGCFDSLSEALNLLMHIYDRLENFHDQQKLGDFIANIGAPGQYDELLRGTEYDEDVRALTMTIQSNLVLLEYDNSMKAFLQWVFPFAKMYLEKTNLPDSLKPVRNEQTLKDLVVAAKLQLQSIKDDITKYWATIPNHVKFFYNGEFYLNAKIGGPFFVWSGIDYANVIEDIFKGHEVTLFADVRINDQFVNAHADLIAPKRKAIKFSKIYLRFNLDKKYEEKDGDEEAKKKNAERQAKFEDILEYFMVNMTHSGTSYYDFRDNVYVIYGDPVVLSYSIKKDAAGKPDVKSVSRDKIMQGDLLLSPYTLWTVRLSADKKKAFDDMKEFLNDISLELRGEGSYIFDEFDELAKYRLKPYDYYQIDGKRRETLDAK